MKANELRIGSLVFNDYLKCNGEIVGIHESEVWIQYPNSAISSLGVIDACHGIPLTEEWLLKFGFTSELIRVIGFIDFIIVSKETSVIIEIGKQTFELFYVHQLQNLHFALTGEELIWKDK
jgi:hypothetical protein